VARERRARRRIEAKERLGELTKLVLSRIGLQFRETWHRRNSDPSCFGTFLAGKFRAI